MSRAITEKAKAEKAELILNVAHNLYIKNTFDNIKMVDIAKACGVSKGTLFNYYSTKEKIFLSLLRKEYKIRFENFINKLKAKERMNHCEFKKVVLEEMGNILEENSVLVRLTAILHIILEANIDYETALEFKSEFYEAAKEISVLISEKVDYMSLEDAMELMMAQHAIVVGFRNAANVPQVVKQVIEEQKFTGFQIDFKKNTLKTMECYLEGLYTQNMKNK